MLQYRLSQLNIRIRIKCFYTCSLDLKMEGWKFSVAYLGIHLFNQNTVIDSSSDFFFHSVTSSLILRGHFGSSCANGSMRDNCVVSAWLAQVVRDFFHETNHLDFKPPSLLGHNLRVLSSKHMESSQSQGLEMLFSQLLALTGILFS